MIGARITDHALDGRTHVIEVVGQIDLHTAPRLNERALDVIDQGARWVIFDLSGVSFIDSAGIAALLDVLRSLHAAEGSMAVVIRDRAVERIFRITGLTEAFLLCRGREQARAALEAREAMRLRQAAENESS
jgi:anti-sigma B factor antagonist